MVIIHFYEKPGCINNTKQKALLTASGHELEVHNLLTAPWTPETLRPFFGNLPVVDWFNPTAPQVKSGEIVPEQLDEETALSLMIHNPILIRRPLLQVKDQRVVGFDMRQIDAWIGLQPIGEPQRRISESLKQQDLQTCPNQH